MLKSRTGYDQSVQMVTCAICGYRVTFVIVKSVSSVRLVISTSKCGRRSVAAGPTVTSQESSLLTVDGDAANADVVARSSRIDRLFIVVAYGVGLIFVPVQSAAVPFDNNVPGGQTNTPPAGPIVGFVVVMIAAGEHPLLSDAASNSATNRFVPRLPNIVIVTQFWLGRGPTVCELRGARALVLPAPVTIVGTSPMTLCVVTE